MKAGFIAVVGRPNVGKSTLINKLVAEKVAIVSDKAGTTRDNIRGILNHKGNQYIFIDTPGIYKANHLLGEYMTNSALSVLNNVDVILLVLDGNEKIGEGDKFAAEQILKIKDVPKVILVNKMDLISDEDIELKKQEIDEKIGGFDDVVIASGKFSFGLERLLLTLEKYLEDDIQYYPEDMYTDMPIYKMISEIVREKILIKTRDEIPHSVAIEIINIDKKNNSEKDVFDINIYVERNSQKGIIIGKNGSLLKEIGTEARKDIEELLEKKIYLNLWVKVKDNWRKKKATLRDLGYELDLD